MNSASRVRRGLPLADDAPVLSPPLGAWARESAPEEPTAMPVAEAEAEARAEEAYREGRSEGRREAEAELAPLAAELSRAAREFERERASLPERLRRALEERLGAAAAALAGALAPEAAATAARALAEEAGQTGSPEAPRIHCAPESLEALERLLGGSGPALQAAPDLPPGALRASLGDATWEALPADFLRMAEAAARGRALERAWRAVGTVVRTRGPLLEAEGLRMNLGDLAEVGAVERPLLAEAVGFDGARALLSPLGDLRGVGPGERVAAVGRPLEVPAGRGLLGRVLDALGRPLEGSALPEGLNSVRVHPLYAERDPLKLGRVQERLETRVSALDLFFTCGRGQRLGIFSGSGVGKSTLLGMLARGSKADAVVIGLIGERGREVRDFLERVLGDGGRARSTVVVATSDQPPALRVQAALTATAVAEALRDEGAHVLLLMDSVTRFAQSLREIGLSLGEPPATRGYPPSVFAALPRLLERSGPLEGGGSITAFYTVLVEGDDMNEPVADAVRGILDGHIILSRQVGESGRYPAVDLLASLSRCMAEVTEAPHQEAARRARRLFSALDAAKDLISVGAYREGTDPLVDEARRTCPRIEDLLRQGPDEARGLPESLAALTAILGGASS